MDKLVKLFQDKFLTIIQGCSVTVKHAPSPNSVASSYAPLVFELQPCTIDEITKLLAALKSTDASCDVIPAWFLKLHATLLATLVTKLFNLSVLE